MNRQNEEVRRRIERNEKIYSALRRSDIVMQLRDAMVAKGLRNVDVAQRLGVSEANVSRWLKGNQNLGLDTLYALADAIEEPLTLVVGMHQTGTVYKELDSSGQVVRPWVAMNDQSHHNNVVRLDAYASIRGQRSLAPFKQARSDQSITTGEVSYEFAAAAS